MKRKELGGVNTKDADEKNIVFKRMSDIHSLNQKYFKEKPAHNEVKQEDAEDMYTVTKKNEYDIIILLYYYIISSYKSIKFKEWSRRLTTFKSQVEKSKFNVLQNNSN